MSEILEKLAGMEAELREAFCEAGVATYSVDAAIHRHTMLVSREVHAQALLNSAGLWSRDAAEYDAKRHFPLPPRKVLREETVPGVPHGALFRVNGGSLERRAGSGEWMTCRPDSNGFDLMRHALDLHDNPYKEEPE